MQTKEAFRESIREGKILFIDKPFKWTSFDVVNKLKALLQHRLGMKKIKVGHAGTLDPLATGLLIVCTGKATKQIEQFQVLDKTYTGTFHVGKSTPSYDLETAPDKDYPTGHVTKKLANEAAKLFIGEQQQIPPLFSAKKIAGERAYTFAREGKDVVLAANNIHIKKFEITSFNLPEIGFRVVCSKGTYIRSLARDFGEALGSGAYLSELRRTHIGDHDVTDAWSIQTMTEAISAFEK